MLATCGYQVVEIWQFLGESKIQNLTSRANTGFPGSVLLAQLIKNPPATWETWVRSLGWEDPLEEGKATHSSILAWRIPWAI